MRLVKNLNLLLCLVLAAACSTHYTKLSESPGSAPSSTNQPDNFAVSSKQYVVKKGDTLAAIGRQFGFSYRQLAYWNGINPPYVIRVGQVLNLFGPNQSFSVAAAKSLSVADDEKKRSSSQKKSINSIDNRKVLKLYWQWPLKGSILKPYSAGDHKGINIGGEVGQIVRAAAAGKVVYSGDGLLGYGNLLIIKHDDMFLSAYANNSKLLVGEGAEVEAGQAIAEVGGVGSQAYLHFEIRKRGKPVNPIAYLPTK